MTAAPRVALPARAHHAATPALLPAPPCQRQAASHGLHSAISSRNRSGVSGSKAHTTPEGESVRDYTARLHPELNGEELERAYQRLKRARQRTQGRVRMLLFTLEAPDAR